MKISKAELLERVYRYYARGIGSRDPNYFTTEEKLRLVDLCKNAGTGEPYDRFCHMLRRLESQFPELNIQNGSLGLVSGDFDACYSAKLWLPSSAPDVVTYYLGFFIGLIAPVYIVYRMIRHAPPESTTWSWTEQVRYMKEYPFEHSFTFTAEEKPYVDAISTEIEATFNAELLPPELGKLIVPDVYAGHRLLGEETLYTCLCSDRW